MKIGIMADSHENMPMIRKAVELFNANGVQYVLHAGDIISPITVKEFSRLKARFIGVFGNNDGEKFFLREKFAPFGKIHEGSHQMELADKKILLKHSQDLVEALAESGAFDLIIYGHTHELDIRKGKTLIINPGETGGWLKGKSTVVILDTETMRPEVFDLG